MNSMSILITLGLGLTLLPAEAALQGANRDKAQVSNSTSAKIKPKTEAKMEVTRETREGQLTRAQYQQSVRQKWRLMERSMADSMNSIGTQIKQTLDNLERQNISLACRLALDELVEGVREQRMWASHTLDASARLPSGLLGGTLTELGNFDQCLSVRYQLESSAALTLRERLVTGQYCTVQVKPPLAPRARFSTVCQRAIPFGPLNLTGMAGWLSQNGHQFQYTGLRMGVCTPSKCGKTELQFLLNSYLSKYQLTGHVKSCQVAPVEELLAYRLDSVQQCIVAAFVLLLFMTALGSLLDLLASEPKTSALKSRGNCKSSQPVASLDTMDPMTTRQEALNRRRWHYSLYRGACNSLHDPQSWPGIQKNPLAKIGTHTIDKQHITTELDEEAIWPAGHERNKLEMSSTPSLRLSSFLLCFSLRKNLKAITAHSRQPGGGEETRDIKVIHGLRTLTMFWIIFGHTIGLVSPDMMNNLLSLSQLSCSSRLLQALLNATLAVNTFFMISGLVTVVSFARRCNSVHLLLSKNDHLADAPKRARKVSLERPRTGSELCSDSSSIMMSSSTVSSSSSDRCIDPKAARQSGLPADFQPLKWMLMRYLRLTPAYAAVIGIAIVLPALGSGPFWVESVESMGPSCRENWWTNLVYVNNFIDTDRLCLIHSWYLSNDWQFFTLSLILFGLFYKSKKLALVVSILLIAGSSAVAFVLTVNNELPPTIVTTSPATPERWLYIHSLYYKPWPHLSSYLIGTFIGYLILIKDRIRMSSMARVSCWILFGILALSLLNSIYPWNMGIQVEPILAGLHGATFRSLWALCCGWLVFALVTRPRSALAKLLSWHVFQVTSRLTYCAYLVHPLVIFYHFGSLRERIDSSVYGQLHRFLATLVLSYLLAMLLSLFIESPSIQLQWLLSGKVVRERCALSQHKGHSWGGSSTCTDQITTISDMASADSFKVQLNNDSCCESAPKDTILEPAILKAALCPHQAALDAEFQRKLAQAIGRGFRIRSRLANGSISQSAGGASKPAEPVKPAVDAKREEEILELDEPTNGAKRRGELSTFFATNHKFDLDRKLGQDLIERTRASSNTVQTNTRLASFNTMMVIDGSRKLSCRDLHNISS